MSKSYNFMEIFMSKSMTFNCKTVQLKEKNIRRIKENCEKIVWQ